MSFIRCMDIIGVICAYVELADLLRFSTTSKKNKEIIYAQIKYISSTNIPSSAMLPFMNFFNLVSLTITCADNIQSLNLPRNVQYLKVLYCSNLLHITHPTSNLKNLEIRACKSLTSMSPGLQECMNLQVCLLYGVHMYIDQPLPLSLDTFAFVTTHQTPFNTSLLPSHLQRLEIGNYINVDIDAIKYKIPLAMLKMVNSDDTYKLLTACIDTNNIQFLSLVNMKETTTNLFQQLPFPKLRHLQLTHTHTLDALQFLTSLEELNISHCNITIEALYSILDKLPRLKRLDISHTHIMRQNMSIIYSTYPHIQVIYHDRFFFDNNNWSDIIVVDK